MGVPVQAITDLIALRYVVGLAGPLFGSLRSAGHRPIILGSLALFGASMWLIPLWPGYTFLALGLGLTMLAKAIYDPAVYGYLGDAVPYARRGRAVGFLEISWAGGMFIGAPFVGFVIAQQGWQAPWWLGSLALFTVGILWWTMPATQPTMRQGQQATVRVVLRQRPIIWVVLVLFSVSPPP